MTRVRLAEDLHGLGLRSGDAVLAHGALSRIGRLLNGPDIVIGALLDAVSPDGTVLAYTDWDARYDELLNPEGRVPEHWRAHVPPFDPGSAFAKLVEAGGKVAMTGAPWDTMTLLHHAEHLAHLPDKRVIRYELPVADESGTVWRMVEEFDTSRSER